MPNVVKLNFLQELKARFGDLRKIGTSKSLFVLGDGAARVYVRYSKVHEDGSTFFGLRDDDLRQLEGHNAFLCFLRNDGSEPLFIPYTDFEEVFHNAQPAKDGQYKVQLVSNRGPIELYVSRQGRFNVEGYVGFATIAQSLNARPLRESRDLSHAQVQTLLGGIGHMKGYDVYVPENNVAKLDWSLTNPFRLRDRIPAGFEDVAPVLSEIDVIWVARGGNEIGALFEVEHSTSIYSGLLRFNDVFVAHPKVSRFSIVSDDSRRSVFSKQLFRPTFRRSGLAEHVAFLEYANVFDWHARVTQTSSH
jgi:hypothetical protein